MDSKSAQKNTRSASSIPTYQRIEEDIRARVRDGRLPVGTMLASRHNLAKEYGVALSTVQQAIANLVMEGFLETSDRRGTFVASPPVRAENRETAASDAATDGGGSRSVVVSARYLPAPSLTKRPAATLGIVSTARIQTGSAPDVGSLWARMAIRAVEQVFSAAGGESHYFDRYPPHRGPYARGFDDANAIPMSEAIGALLAEGAEALAIIGLCDSRDMSDEIVAAVDIERVPTVYISWHEIRPPLAQVFYDNRYSGYQAAQHLLRKGYQRLLFLAPFKENWLVERIEGARDAVRHAGLPGKTLQVYAAEAAQDFYDIERIDAAAYAVAQQAFAEKQIFDPSAGTPWGLIAPNDQTAYAVLLAATEQGKVVGLDYGLIGFDDDDRSCTVGLTTVRPPVEAMGEEAGRLLLRALQGENSESQMRLRAHVIPRASTSYRPGVQQDATAP